MLVSRKGIWKVFARDLVWLCVIVILTWHCKPYSENEQKAPTLLMGTSDDNSDIGQGARCHSIYRNKQILWSVPSCNHEWMSRDIMGMKTRGKPGMLEVTQKVFSHIFSLETVHNPTAQHILTSASTLLKNMMASEERPIHPAAFFSVIKDYETSANLFQWGDDSYNCVSPKMCTNKCVQGDDCMRWCARHGDMLGERQRCEHSCRSQGQFCDASCYGLFQVDPEINNLEDTGSGLKLLPEEKTHWDYQSICGSQGLGLIGMKGGPDFCALLFWLFAGRGGTNCTFFENKKKFVMQDGELKPKKQILVSGEEEDVFVNPCTDVGYEWTVDTFREAHEAYRQRNRVSAWARRYEGFISESSANHVYGYEHCAADGFAGYDYRFSSNLQIPPEALRRSVLDFACKVGVLPDWADSEDCP